MHDNWPWGCTSINDIPAALGDTYRVANAATWDGIHPLVTAGGTVPTLTEWGLIFLSVLMAGTGSGKTTF